MKIDNKISFGQTYIHPTITKYLSKANQSKLEYSYALGQLYPMDIFLGANFKGDLTVGIKRCNLWDYLTINNLIPCTFENAAKYIFIKRAEMMYEYLYGPKYQIENYIIKDLDYKQQEEIAYEINDKIAEYTKKHGKKFLN